MKTTPHPLPRRTFILGGAAVATTSLTGCLAVATDDYVTRVNTEGLTRIDSAGNIEKYSKDAGWISTAKPEAAIARQAVWYISNENSGIKAWRFGFTSNQNYRYVDPYSPIVEASGFSATGWVTYLVRGNHLNVDEFVVKRANFVRGGDPEILGTMVRVRREWQFTARTGQPVAAYGYHLTSKGIVLLRSATVFTYFPSAQPRAQLLPEGWQLAWAQKGDIESSRLLIVKKLLPTTLLDPGRHLVGFFDIDKGRIMETTLQMSLLLDHEEAQLSNRLFIYDTARGPLAIAMEDGLKQVTVRNLRTGQKRVAFQRDAGIARIKTKQTNTGRVSVEAAVGFSDEELYDAEDFLYSGNRAAPAA